MLFNFFGHTFGKVKNENDMLGFLIAKMDYNKDVPAKVILNESGLDNISCNQLLKSLETSNYIIYSTDIVSVVSLGINNYRSPFKRFIIFIGWRIWDLIVFLAGILSGVLITYLSHILIK